MAGICFPGLESRPAEQVLGTRGRWHYRPAIVPGTLALIGVARLEDQILTMTRTDDLQAGREARVGEPGAHARGRMPGQVEGVSEGSRQGVVLGVSYWLRHLEISKGFRQLG